MKSFFAFILSFAVLLTACQNRDETGQVEENQSLYNKENTQMRNGTRAIPNEEADRNSQGLYNDRNNQTRYGYDTRSPDANAEDRFQGTGQNEIGYFHFEAVNDQQDPSSTNQPDVFIDRSVLAKHIAHLVSVLPHVGESTVLVTDDHVFVGIIPEKGKQNQNTVKEAKRTAESVTPRYYQVHVTDQKELEETIGNIGLQLQRDGDVEGVRENLNDLLKRMGDDTPPG